MLSQQHQKEEKRILGNARKASTANKRTGMDRRQVICEGFTYVSTVGWICRREKSRRKTNDHA
ncbi:hypothetical protein DESC_590049 [Desulfosarcina cetonica]|nr:hypothetical protein DESC_590049 [Desulfosarcina cetonica]